jgi:hypothetical protein
VPTPVAVQQPVGTPMLAVDDAGRLAEVYSLPSSVTITIRNGVSPVPIRFAAPGPDLTGATALLWTARGVLCVVRARQRNYLFLADPDTLDPGLVLSAGDPRFVPVAVAARFVGTAATAAPPAELLTAVPTPPIH